ncbi:MAG: DUF2062 domain-containing protein [Gammaproteobacteria bacterium]
MPKKFIKRVMPNHEVIKGHKSLQFLGDRLHEPDLWHLNRRSVSKAFAIGLFFAWVPLPTQMAMSAAVAFFLRANLPISVALVWVTNPITMPPMFYFAYLLGSWFLGITPSESSEEFSLDSVMSDLGEIWEPFLTGCFILGVACSVLGYAGIRAVWRHHVVKHWRTRPHRHKR